MRQFWTGLILVFCIESTSAQAAERPFRRLLVPVVDTAGVVQWRTTLWLHNAGTHVLHPFPLVSRTDTGTLITDTAFGHETLMMRNINTAGVRPYRVPIANGGQGGAIVYVEADGGGDVVGRIEVSGGGGVPVSLPVVGEEMFHDSFRIEPIPGRPGSRYLLRIYSLDGPEGTIATVHVRSLYALGVAETLTEQVSLHATPVTLDCFPFGSCALPDLPYTPYFAAVPLTLTNDSRLPYDILVEAADPNVRIWGMVTLTANCGDQGCASAFVPW